MFKIRKIIYVSCLLLIIIFQAGKVEAAETVTTTTAPVSVEEQVRAYFADIPVMIEIARCESSFRQFTDDGSVLRGGGGEFVGIFQIYESVHTKAATALGFDLTSIEGNMAYAKHLYQESGSNPWSSCVPEVAADTVVVNTSEVSDTELLAKIELLKQLLSLLQQLLALQQGLR